MIAGLPVTWIPYSGDGMPAILRPYDKVYVRSREGAEPQHPLRADHVHWANMASFALARHDSDQDIHHNAAQVLAVTRDDFYPGDGAE